MRYHKRYFSSKSKASSLCLSLVRNPNPFAVPCVVFPWPGALGLQVPWCCRMRRDSASLAVFLEGEGGGGKCGASERGISWCLSNPTQHHALCCSCRAEGCGSAQGTEPLKHPEAQVRGQASGCMAGLWGWICLLLAPKHCTYLHYPRSSAFLYLKGTWPKMEVYQTENLFHFYSK